MRRFWTIIVVLSISTIGFARGDEPDSKTDKARKTDGTWQLVEAEVGGMKLPEDVTKNIQLILKGDRYTVVTAEGKDEGTVRSKPGKTFEELDITGTKGPNKGKTFLAISELDGDTLKICYDLSGRQRPKEFKSKPGTQLFNAVYKRQKP
jgi:uncharacterized protein (TIGR03067 family)